MRICSKVLLLAVLIAGCGPAPHWKRPPSGTPIVRVLLAEGVDLVTLAGSGPFRVFSPAEPDKMLALEGGDKVKLKPGDGGRVLVWVRDDGPRTELALPVRVAGTDGQASISYGGRSYRGAIELMKGAGGVLVVNSLDIESYLRGVVPSEIGYLEEKALEAVKAQAVAARTYALKRMGKNDGRGYDLVATVADQAYLGKSAEQKLADRAIMETAGIVAVHRKKLIDAFYSSTCGGRTANIDDVWEREKAPYLKGVKDCPKGGSDVRNAYCSKSPYFEWTVTWQKDEIERILGKSLPTVLGAKKEDLGEIKGVRIRGTTRCGRVKWLEIRMGSKKYKVWGDRIRWVLRQPNGKSLWSTKFEIKVKRSRGRIKEVIATGRGFGHGIGMCQEGVIEMARQGKRYDEILKHYYPKSRLQQIPYAPVS